MVFCTINDIRLFLYNKHNIQLHEIVIKVSPLHIVNLQTAIKVNNERLFVESIDWRCAAGNNWHANRLQWTVSTPLALPEEKPEQVV